MKLNIGCGPNGQLPGFVNVDNSRAILLEHVPFLKRALHHIGWLSTDKFRADWRGVVRMDAGRRLHFPDNSVAKIYTSHFLEHLPRDRGRKFLSECYRVLSSGGCLRVVVPDLGFHVERYLRATRKMLAENRSTWTCEVHQRFLDTVYGAYLERARYGLKHCYMYDRPSLILTLENIGFEDVTEFGFRQGTDSELCLHDSRPSDSLHIECRKPFNALSSRKGYARGLS